MVRNKTRANVVMLCVVLVFALSFGVQAAEEPQVWRLAHGGGYGTVLPSGEVTEHHLTLGCDKFSELVFKRTNGQIKIVTYPGLQLGGSEEEYVEDVKMGVLEMTAVAAGPFSRIAPTSQIAALPFLFKDFAHVDRVMQGEIGNELLAEAESAGIKALAFGEDGFRWIHNSKRPINSIDDVKGLKIRVQSAPIYAAIMKAIGATGVTVPWGEVYTSIQTGVVDGADNDARSGISIHLQEVTKYLAVVPVSYSFQVMLMNLDLWNSLSPDLQKIVLDAARESRAIDRNYTRWQLDSALQEVKSAGMVVTTPDLAPFQEATEVVWDSYFKKNPDWKPIVEKILALAEE